MILVDTCVWAEHIRLGNEALANLLNDGLVLIHTFIIGELALGTFKQRQEFLETLEALPQAFVAEHDEVMRLIDQQQLFGRGVGYVDAHLLAAARLTGNTAFWTHDRRLRLAAQHLGLKTGRHAH